MILLLQLDSSYKALSEMGMIWLCRSLSKVHSEHQIYTHYSKFKVTQSICVHDQPLECAESLGICDIKSYLSTGLRDTFVDYASRSRKNRL